MKNPATHQPKRDELNAFTEILKEFSEHGHDQLVMLRCGKIVEVSWYDAEGPDYQGFRTRDGRYCWYCNGESIQNDELDMMETV